MTRKKMDNNGIQEQHQSPINVPIQIIDNYSNTLKFVQLNQ